jgi:uncharacterized membrane protein
MPPSTAASSGNLFLAATFALVTALFWGTYGPLLHKGSIYMGPYAPDMGLGRMRPFLCVGLAYFVIAIIAPLVVMQVMGVERGNGLFAGWKWNGIIWSFGGGAVGALGAFALIMALNNGTPVQVMPLVFGIAPIVSTAVGMYFNKTFDKVSPFFFVGLVLVSLGAVTILLTAPKPPAGGHGKPKEKPASASDVHPKTSDPVTEKAD